MRDIGGRVEVALPHVRVHPGFRGFDRLGMGEDSKLQRRSFILGLEALLQKWDGTEPHA